MEKLFTMECSHPGCQTIITYKEKWLLNKALRENRKCRKCATIKTQEHKDKISKAIKEYRQTVTPEEHFGGSEKYLEMHRRHGDTMRGRKRPPFSREWKDNMSESRKNSEVYQNWMKSDEYREKRRKIAVENYHENLTYEEWLEMTDDRQIYYAQVCFHSEKQCIEILENYEKRGLAGVEGAYHLDHIMPISYGFKHQISPEIIGHITNLQFLPWLENLRKSNKYEERNNEDIREIDNNQS